MDVEGFIRTYVCNCKIMYLRLHECNLLLSIMYLCKILNSKFIRITVKSVINLQPITIATLVHNVRMYTHFL